MESAGLEVTVTGVIRFGTRYSVSLSCGHKLKISADELAKNQLYIGRKLTCELEH